MSLIICERCGDAYEFTDSWDSSYCPSCVRQRKEYVSEAKTQAEDNWSWEPCPRCGGHGKLGSNRLTCDVCDGDKRVKSTPSHFDYLPTDFSKTFYTQRVEEKERRQREREEEREEAERERRELAEERRKEAEEKRREEAEERRREAEGRREEEAEKRREEERERLNNSLDNLTSRSRFSYKSTSELLSGLSFGINSESDDDSDEEEKDDKCHCYVVSSTLKSLGLQVLGSEEIGLMKKLKTDFLGRSFSGLREVVRYNRLAPKIVSAINQREDREEIYSSIYHHDLSNVMGLLRKGDYESGYREYKRMILDLSSKLDVN